MKKSICLIVYFIFFYGLCFCQDSEDLTGIKSGFYEVGRTGYYTQVFIGAPGLTSDSYIVERSELHFDALYYGAVYDRSSTPWIEYWDDLDETKHNPPPPHVKLIYYRYDEIELHTSNWFGKSSGRHTWGAVLPSGFKRYRYSYQQVRDRGATKIIEYRWQDMSNEYVIPGRFWLY